MSAFENVKNTQIVRNPHIMRIEEKKMDDR